MIRSDKVVTEHWSIYKATALVAGDGETSWFAVDVPGIGEIVRVDNVRELNDVVSERIAAVEGISVNRISVVYVTPPERENLRDESGDLVGLVLRHSGFTKFDSV